MFSKPDVLLWSVSQMGLYCLTTPPYTFHMYIYIYAYKKTCTCTISYVVTHNEMYAYESLSTRNNGDLVTGMWLIFCRPPWVCCHPHYVMHDPQHGALADLTLLSRGDKSPCTLCGCFTPPRGGREPPTHSREACGWPAATTHTHTHAHARPRTRTRVCVESHGGRLDTWNVVS